MQSIDEKWTYQPREDTPSIHEQLLSLSAESQYATITPSETRSVPADFFALEGEIHDSSLLASDFFKLYAHSLILFF